jgi:hypothetical protein
LVGEFLGAVSLVEEVSGLDDPANNRWKALSTGYVKQQMPRSEGHAVMLAKAEVSTSFTYSWI